MPLSSCAEGSATARVVFAMARACCTKPRRLALRFDMALRMLRRPQQGTEFSLVWLLLFQTQSIFLRYRSNRRAAQRAACTFLTVRSRFLRFACRLKSLRCVFAFFFAFSFLICSESALSSTGKTGRFDVLGPPCAGVSLVVAAGKEHQPPEERQRQQQRSAGQRPEQQQAQQQAPAVKAAVDKAAAVKHAEAEAVLRKARDDEAAARRSVKKRTAGHFIKICRLSI